MRVSLIHATIVERRAGRHRPRSGVYASGYESADRRLRPGGLGLALRMTPKATM